MQRDVFGAHPTDDGRLLPEVECLVVHIEDAADGNGELLLFVVLRERITLAMLR